jgi:hypothetical protein
MGELLFHTNGGQLMEVERERAVIGIDGNCGYALLGENLQEGESEFVEIDDVDDPRAASFELRYYSDEWCEAARTAARRALDKLRARLGYTIDTGKWLSYALDRSHPDSV